MKNVNYGNRKTIYCIWGIMILWTLGAHAAALPPNPDNAALLYYQAFQLRPEPDDATFLQISNVLRGAEPDEKVRQYLDDCRETIRIADTATQISHCNWGWGIMRSERITFTPVIGQIRQLAFLLEVDARALIADGNYRPALERCLSIRRLAQHITDEAVIGYLISLSFHGNAFRCIQHILSSMFPDADTLTWLQGRLSNVQGAPPSPGKAIEVALDDTVQFLRMNPELLTPFLATWRENVSERIEDENIRQELLSLTDEEVLERAKNSYNSFLASVHRVIGSDTPYQQKHLELQGLKEELLGPQNSCDPVGILLLFLQYDVVEHYNIYVRWTANFNAIRTAIELYITMVNTGQLPDSLPDYMPKDPFSSENFEYEITEEGFVLRCRTEEINVHKTWQYEFKVKK